MKPCFLVPLTLLMACPLSAWAAPQTAPAYPAMPAPVAPPAPQSPASAPAAPLAPAVPAPPAHRNANRVQGHVTAVDTIKRTFTIDPRGAAGPVTVSVAPNAKFTVSGQGSIASLKVGDTVSVYGQATPEAPTLTTSRIVVLPAPAPAKRALKPNVGFHPKRVEGTVTTLAPAMTITTPGKLVVTVTLAPNARVETLAAGAFSDIAVGQTVDVHVGGDPAAPIATEVRVLPARAGGGKQGDKRARLNNGPAPSAAPAP